jgi:hypothetical protein
MKAAQPFVEDRRSVRRSRRRHQFGKELRMAQQTPPFHSFYAVEAGCRVGLGKPPISEAHKGALKFGQRETE